MFCLRIDFLGRNNTFVLEDFKVVKRLLKKCKQSVALVFIYINIVFFHLSILGLATAINGLFFSCLPGSRVARPFRNFFPMFKFCQYFHVMYCRCTYILCAQLTYMFQTARTQGNPYTYRIDRVRLDELCKQNIAQGIDGVMLNLHGVE